MAMTRPDSPPRGPVLSILRGVWRLGRGDAEGFNDFRSGPDAVLAAMAPSLALYLIVFVGQLVHGPSVLVLTNLLVLLAALLARLIVTHGLAVRWSRQGLWMRYAAASLWCDWLPGLLSLLMSVLLHLMLPSVGDTPGGTLGIFLAIEGYDLWLSWFVARAGLALTRGQAVLLVAAVLAVTLAFYGVAALLPPHYVLWAELAKPLFGK
ncbi:hypothetical protein [Acidomonas methanolica]|uniref:Yip1 domain-containing protein n=1 Tax=Acidomonas methanolica NBRC 104435 TaxID=1231351 RepID=A0A023D079_ACIMT|nr:hypothetical protein [Acidomonas methanolica]MBU2653902.1 hypothetical protein [Acidomonas methanolica]TCS30862.1 hypothetical protein EDC31_10457 [Acidomonas methanolica]GAJ27573.1 hypothetical protein Amme_002_016 [Acidomonas methanolica NBRC 104435]GEK98341.1 hypothetical protein AME01nite_08400 [Acidomonas methanolica NBRC 104435]